MRIVINGIRISTDNSWNPTFEEFKEKCLSLCIESGNDIENEYKRRFGEIPRNNTKNVKLSSKDSGDTNKVSEVPGGNTI